MQAPASNFSPEATASVGCTTGPGFHTPQSTVQERGWPSGQRHCSLQGGSVRCVQGSPCTTRRVSCMQRKSAVQGPRGPGPGGDSWACTEFRGQQPSLLFFPRGPPTLLPGGGRGSCRLCAPGPRGAASSSSPPPSCAPGRAVPAPPPSLSAAEPVRGEGEEAERPPEASRGATEGGAGALQGRRPGPRLPRAGSRPAAAAQHAAAAAAARRLTRPPARRHAGRRGAGGLRRGGVQHLHDLRRQQPLPAHHRARRPAPRAARPPLRPGLPARHLRQAEDRPGGGYRRRAPSPFAPRRAAPPLPGPGFSSACYGGRGSGNASRGPGWRSLQAKARDLGGVRRSLAPGFHLLPLS